MVATTNNLPLRVAESNSNYGWKYGVSSFLVQVYERLTICGSLPIADAEDSNFMEIVMASIRQLAKLLEAFLQNLNTIPCCYSKIGSNGNILPVSLNTSLPVYAVQSSVFSVNGRSSGTMLVIIHP